MKHPIDMRARYGILAALVILGSACTTSKSPPDTGSGTGREALSATSGAPADSGSRCDTAAFDASCSIGCPMDYAKGTDGCRICECRAIPEQLAGGCPNPLTCPARCEFGYRPGADGCLTCECGENPGDGDEGGQGSRCDTAAFDASCSIGCPMDYAKGTDGCRICECRAIPEQLAGGCPNPLTCPARCEFGYRPGADGCLTCECGENPGDGD